MRLYTALFTVTPLTKPELTCPSVRLGKAPILGGVVDQPFPLRDNGIDIGGFPTVRRAFLRQIIRASDQTSDERIRAKIESVNHVRSGNTPFDELAFP